MSSITALNTRTLNHGTTTPRTSAQPAVRLRITARGRLVLTVAVVLAALAIVAAMVLSGGGAVATGSTANVQFEHVTVSAGETLWQVAEEVAPNADPRDVISDMVKLNNLSTTDVMPGQSLAVPLKYSK